MATLRVRDLVEGKLYREPISGYTVRMRRVTQKDALGEAQEAECRYYNTRTGRFCRFLVIDGDLEEYVETEQKRYQR